MSDLPGRPVEREKGLARAATEMLLGNTLAKIVAAIAGVLVARALGPSDRGSLALILLAVTGTATLAACGTDLSVLRAGRRSEQDPRLRGLLAAQTAIVGPAVILAGASILMLCSRWTGLSSTIVWLSTALAIMTSAFMPASVAPLAKGRPSRFALGLLLESTMPLAAALFMLATSTSNVPLLLAAWSLGRAMGAINGWLVLRPPTVFPGRSAYTSAIRFGAPSALGLLLTQAIYRADAIVIGALEGTEAVGLYVAAAALIEFMYVLPDSVAQVLVGRIDENDTGTMTAGIVRVVSLVVAIVAAILALAGPWVMQLVYGSGFRSGWVCLPPLAGAAVAMTIWRVLIFDLAGRGHTRIRVSSGALGLVVMLAADVLLVSRYGIVGASFGAWIGYSAAASLATRRWTQDTAQRAIDLFGLRSGDLREARRSIARSGVR